MDQVNLQGIESRGQRTIQKTNGGRGDLIAVCLRVVHLVFQDGMRGDLLRSIVNVPAGVSDRDARIVPVFQHAV